MNFQMDSLENISSRTVFLRKCVDKKSGKIHNKRITIRYYRIMREALEIVGLGRGKENADRKRN